MGSLAVRMKDHFKHILTSCKYYPGIADEAFEDFDVFVKEIADLEDNYKLGVSQMIMCQYETDILKDKPLINRLLTLMHSSLQTFDNVAKFHGDPATTKYGVCIYKVKK